MTLSASWTRTDNLLLITDLCHKWNRGNLYEILGEYSELKPANLYEKKVGCWLYKENENMAGFALVKKMENFSVIEEIWGPFQGLFGDQMDLLDTDKERARLFNNSIVAALERPLLLRGATDNHFAHGLARALSLPWFNGVVIAARNLTEKVPFKPPENFSLRNFVEGDEEFFECLHHESFDETISAKDFRRWATAPNVTTFVAVKGSQHLGFIIAERRPYRSIGDFNMAVKREYQSKGIGSALLNAGMNSLYENGVRRVIADYRTLNAATHSIYSKHGFQPVRIYNYFRLS